MTILKERKKEAGLKAEKEKKAAFEQGAVFYYVKKLFPDAVCRYTEGFEPPMGIDVYIPSQKTGIDYDRLFRHKTEDDFKAEVRKYLLCNKLGIRLFRITEEDPRDWADTADEVYCVLGGTYKTDFGVVLQYLLDLLDPEISNLKTEELQMTHNRIWVDIVEDRNRIQEFLNAVNDPLEKLRQDLAGQWHPDKNGKLTPGEVGIFSNAKVWWKCPQCGFEWEEAVSQRGKRRDSSCPECVKQNRKEKIGKLKSAVFRRGAGV